MALLPAGEAGKLLQWYDTGGGVYALRNRSMDDLFDEISSTGPTSNKYYLDVSGVATEAAAPAFSGSGSIAALSVKGYCNASAAAVSGTGALATASMSTGVGASTSAAAVTGTGTLATVTVTVGGGGALSASDNFNRANGSIGANWAPLTGTNAPLILSNILNGNATPPSSARWAVAATTGNEFAEIYNSAGISGYNGPVGPAARMSATAQTCYVASAADDGMEMGTMEVELWKVVNGTRTMIVSDAGGHSWVAGLRVETSGTAITVKWKAAEGDAWSTAINAQADSSILASDTDKRGVGFYLSDVSTSGWDNWAGGDL